jgi:hypothetical protein
MTATDPNNICRTCKHYEAWHVVGGCAYHDAKACECERFVK